MAKKARTPAPPKRPVQAPKRRDPHRSEPTGSRGPLVYAVGGAVVVLAIVGVVLFFVLRGGDGGSPKSTSSAAGYNALPGIRKTKAPWAPEYEFLADRLLPLGLTPLAQEALAFHIHQHVDIFVNGKPVEVPPLIGINPGAQYLTELHTHDSRGVIHVESAANRDYTLGQLFAEWAVRLDGRCLGAYCNDLKWYVNGKQQTGDPQDLVLKERQEIAIVVGKAPQKIPSTYAFQAGE